MGIVVVLVVLALVVGVAELFFATLKLALITAVLLVTGSLLVKLAVRARQRA